MTKTTVGLLPPGTKFTTCLTRRAGTKLLDDGPGALVELRTFADDGAIEKELHPAVVVEITE